MSGCCFLLDGLVVNAFENIRPGQLQEHQASLRNSRSTPLGNRWRLHIAKSSNFSRSAKRIDNLIRVHVHLMLVSMPAILGAPNGKVKACLTMFILGLPI